jgi:ribose transport system permease protein
MTTSAVRTSSAAASTYLLVPIVLFFALLIVAVLRSESLVTSAGLGSAIIVATPLVLATYALMAIAIAGRGTVDLSIGPLIGFINVTLVTLFGNDIISSPTAFFLYALGVGVAYQAIMGLIIVFVRVQPIIVSLSGYLALSGINLVIMERPGGTAPEWMMDWGLGTSIFSPVTAILVVATVAWLLFTRTAFYNHLRLMGSDERAAFTSGVRINLVRLGAHVISGLFAGLAALTFTSLISSGDPTQGTTYTLIAVTALVLGGASLAGGRGGVMGSLLGAVNIYLITYVLATFNFGAVQSFVTDLAYGTILVLSLLLTVVLPHIRGIVRSISPLLFFVILSLIALGVIIHATYDYSVPGQAVSTGADTGMVSLSGQSLQAPATTAPAPETSVPTVAEPWPFIFEAGPTDTIMGLDDSLWPTLAAAGLLLLCLVIIVRTSVAQAEGSRSLSPLVYVVVTGVVLLAVYAVSMSSGESTAGDMQMAPASTGDP